MLIDKNLVHEWIKNSSFWRTSVKFEESTIEFPYYVESENVTNIEEFSKLLQFCTFIDIDKIPYSIYIYGYYNKNEVSEYFKKKLSNDHSERFINYLRPFNRDNFEYYSKILDKFKSLKEYPDNVPNQFSHHN